MTEAAKKSLEAALLKVQADLENPKTDKENPHFHNKYVSLGALLDLVRPVITTHGLVLIQGVDQMENGWALWTHLMNDAGDQLINIVPLLPEKPGPQGMGSAITYARRQGLCAILGIAGEDDDDANLAEPAVEDAGEAPVAKQDEVDEAIGKIKDSQRTRIDKMLKLMSGEDGDKYKKLLKDYSFFIGSDGKEIYAKSLTNLKDSWIGKIYHNTKEAFADWCERNNYDASEIWRE